ncbi:MAG: hypothetical protein CUN53_05515 [Phototrophicales bacterium]|nr:MAG: hypothetical protein CUN53_05515 [Phototrophicales bacterium]
MSNVPQTRNTQSCACRQTSVCEWASASSPLVSYPAAIIVVICPSLYYGGMILMWQGRVRKPGMTANQQPSPRRWSVQEYLENERRSDEKHEYLDGRVVLMAGGTPDHNRICANTIAALISALSERDCDVFTSDQKVRVGAARFVYPDVTVVCGEAQFDEDILLNPTLIVEVLSERTAARDRGEKGFAYRACPSLQGYLLIEQGEPRIESYFRQPDGGWQMRDADGIESALDLPPLQVTIALRDLYRRIAFDPTLGGDESSLGRP